MGQGLLLEEVLEHLDDVTPVPVAEVEAEVPGVVEGDGLVAAVPADHLGKQLPRKVVANY